MTCTANGWALKVLVDTGTFDGSSDRFLAVSESLRRVRSIGPTQITRGTTSQYADCVRERPSFVRGTLVLEPTVNVLQNWMPKIIGAGGVSNEIATFNMLIHRENGVFSLSDCVVNTAVISNATLSGQDGEEIATLAIEILGKLESNGTWPDPEPGLVSGQTYGISDASLTLDSTTRQFRRFKLTINNRRYPSGFHSSLSPLCWRSRGREIFLETENPFSSSMLTLSQGMTDTPVSGSISLAGGGSATFGFPALRNNYSAPTVQNRGPVFLPLRMQAFRTDSESEMSFTSLVP